MSQAGIINVAGSSPEIPTSFVTDSGTAVPVANVLNILGGTDITTSASVNTVLVTFTGASGGITWNTITSADNITQIVAGNGYICRGSSQCVLVLPVAPNIGDTFIVCAVTSLFQITENASQMIRMGSATSTAGSGNLTANSAGDYVEIVYVGSNLFFAKPAQGTLTLN